MNKLIKKVLVGITAATMMFGSVCTAYAATDSATVAPAPEKQTNVKADNGAKVSKRYSNRKGFTKDNKEECYSSF